MRKSGQPCWFDLPHDRGNIDCVENHLKEWAALHSIELNDEDQAKNLFLNSVVHTLECALLLLLAPYANMRGFDSEIFRDGVELAHYCNRHVFPYGYPLEMIEALSLCYSFEEPWSLSEECANKYATELVIRLKDLALYSVEELEYFQSQYKKSQQNNAKKPRKKTASGDIAEELALELFLRWNVDPKIYKNKSAFCDDIADKEWCSRRTADEWCKRFTNRKDISAELKKKLPQLRK